MTIVVYGPLYHDSNRAMPVPEGSINVLWEEINHIDHSETLCVLIQMKTHTLKGESRSDPLLLQKLRLI